MSDRVLRRIEARLEGIEHALRMLLVFTRLEVMEMGKFSDKIDEVTAEVTEQKTVVEGAKTLLDSLTSVLAEVKAELEADDVENEKLDGVLKNLRDNKESLAAAVAKNTPAQDEVHPAGM